MGSCINSPVYACILYLSVFYLILDSRLRIDRKCWWKRDQVSNLVSEKVERELDSAGALFSE